MINDDYITVAQCMPEEFRQYFDGKHELFEFIDFGAGVYDPIVDSVMKVCNNDFIQLSQLLECNQDIGEIIFKYCLDGMNSRAYL